MIHDHESRPREPGDPERPRESLERWRAFRAEMNERILGAGHLGLKRFFALDEQAYHDGALDARTKELLGLVASLVLRCDDCVTYHLERCVGLGVTRDEALEAMNVGLVVGGSIVIPHLRRALATLDALLAERERSREATKV
jgi:AhpD family alkylhydroperoxidase